MGKNWDKATPAIRSIQSTKQQLSTTQRSDEERREILQKLLAEESRHGWKVQHESSFFASLVKGKRPNHILHLLLSIVTLGFWLPVWVILGISMGERNQTIEVDRFGNATFR